MKKIILILMLLSQISYAQNLLTNGTFDIGINGWENGGSAFSMWDSRGVSGGSVQISSTENNGGNPWIKSNRMPVTENRSYLVKGMTKPIFNSEADGSAMWVEWLDENGLRITSTPWIEISTASANGSFVGFEELYQSPIGAKFASLHIAVSTSHDGAVGDSIVLYDNLRFVLKNDDPNSFAMINGHSALWFNASQSGHGINVYLLENQRAIVIWYVYDNSGNPIWLFGNGSHNGFKATLEVSILEGAMFPPDFNSTDINQQVWGEFELEFSGCDTGVFKWLPVAGNGFSNGQMDIIRLSATLGLTCSE